MCDLADISIVEELILLLMTGDRDIQYSNRSLPSLHRTTNCSLTASFPEVTYLKQR